MRARNPLPAAVLFDMDGTLVDSEKMWTVSLHDTAAWLGGTMSPEARDAVVGSNMARTMDILFRDLGLPLDTERMAGTAGYLTTRTGELFAEGLTWRPGAREALAMVAGAGIRAALVTNTERALTERALDTIGREHFAASVCGDEVPRGKPDPDPYLRAAHLLGVAPVECLAVEDSPTGALAAQRAGVPVLVVPCDVAVPGGPGRVLRDSLTGLTLADLQIGYQQARAERAA
jgi:HAD superfamily hydrolase (TIGR01509 family)